MAELNLKQITDKLNEQFSGDTRKLVFWFDDNTEFAEDVDNLELVNAKVLHLEKGNQFYIKYFLECEDRENNYLVYAPFAKPDIKDNHLIDIIKYSKEFFADRASLIALDLGIDDKYKPVIQHYIKFFSSKERTQKFYDMEMENINKSTIEVALLSVLCKNRTVSFDEVLCCVLADGGIEDNKFIEEFKKYDLLKAFWEQVEKSFGYVSDKPTIKQFVITMFVTYASKTIYAEIPSGLKNFVSYKSSSSIVFIDNLMNSYIYGQQYDDLANEICKLIDGDNVLKKIDVDSVVDCSLFPNIDEKIIAWMVARLENEDIGAKINDKTIPELCLLRIKKHFGKRFSNEYYIIENAYYIIANGKYNPIQGIDKIVENYTNADFKIDRRYRYFYYFYDKLEDTTCFDKLKELVENIYTNEFLNKITVNWNDELEASKGKTNLFLQKGFFSRRISRAKDRVVVLISDAFRYEAAYTLYEKLKLDEKCEASITAMQGVLPSYTPLGMAALLPHDTMEYNEDYEVLVDGNHCNTTEQRKNIIRSYKPNSDCVLFDDIKNMRQSELRSIFTGKDVVYIYHNQVDARGDSARTENEVFVACEEAIQEIHSLIRRISSLANTHHFFITADHGFIYKRNKIQANDKINTNISGNVNVGQRYILSDTAVNVEGVRSVELSRILGNNDKRYVSYPLGSDIFKVAGAGQNYVHGGSSPQETIIALVEVKVEAGKTETNVAKISLVSLINKVTNLITMLDFVQTEPVSDVVKKMSYRIYFVSEDNEIVSNENFCMADKKDLNTTNRMFRLRFNFKNKKYDSKKKYYLVAYDENNVEVFRHEIVIDIAFADDFGFFN